MKQSREEEALEGEGLDWPRASRALLAAWLVPGGGHLLLGRRRRGAAFLVIVIVAFAVGVSLDGNLYRIVPDRPLSILATLACMGLGSPYFAFRFLFGYSGDPIAAGFEYGSAFILTAGLMNILLMLDVWDIVIGQKE